MGFGADLDKASKGLIKYAEKWERGTVISLFSAVIQDTPVDSGRAKNNWFVTLTRPSVKVVKSTDKSPKGSISTQKSWQIANTIASSSGDTGYFLTNNLPYIQKLEFGGYGDGPKTSGGYSKQAVGGMVRKNVARIEAISRKNK